MGPSDLAYQELICSILLSEKDSSQSHAEGDNKFRATRRW